MSFSEMMSSGRGPGVIGMLMALVVLIGFGVLFMFASDEGSGEQSIEYLISQQAKEIESYRASINNGRQTLELAPGRVTAARDLARFTRENQSLATNIGTLRTAVEAGKAEVARRVEAFNAYKDEYRAFVRGKAKGESMDQLVTLDGAVYKNVNIREVTAIGIQVRHDDGQMRIPFENLSNAMKDRFQFDPKQKEKALSIEITAREGHEAAVAASDKIVDQQLAVQREKDAELEKEKTKREIAAKKSQISSLRDEIRGLERQIDRAAAEAAAARAAGRMHLNKSSSYGSTIRAKQNQIATLQAEVN